MSKQKNYCAQRIAIASDCDDTLFFRNQKPQVHPDDLTSIQRFRSCGSLFGICTGRPYYGVLEALQPFVSPDFYICTSGAHMLDANGRTLHENKISRETAEELWNMGTKFPYMVVQANGRLYSPAPTSSFQIFVKNFSEIPGNNFYGVSFYAASESEAALMAREVNIAWKGRICAYHNSFCMDIVAAGVSKGTALRQTKHDLNVDIMAAIGDSYNDLSMLKEADISFTFPGTPNEVQANATHIVKSVSEALLLLQSI